LCIATVAYLMNYTIVTVVDLWYVHYWNKGEPIHRLFLHFQENYLSCGGRNGRTYSFHNYFLRKRIIFINHLNANSVLFYCLFVCLFCLCVFVCFALLVYLSLLVLFYCLFVCLFCFACLFVLACFVFYVFFSFFILFVYHLAICFKQHYK
jgi:hypothetical protein